MNDHTYVPALVGLGGPASEARWLLGDADDTPLPPRASASFPDGGVYVLAGERDHVVIDCGPIGLHGRGGHGHNDCLSFEATLDGVKLVTDSGSYVYTASPEQRNRFRGTAAHNTPHGRRRRAEPDSRVAVAARGRHARPEPLLVEELRFRGAHSGYVRLPDPVRVVRTFALDPAAHRLTIEDELDAAGEHDVRVPLHLAAGVAAERTASDAPARPRSRRFRLRWEPGDAWDVHDRRGRVVAVVRREGARSCASSSAARAR